MKRLEHNCVIATLLLFVAAGFANAQSETNAQAQTPASKVAGQSPTTLIDATVQYKSATTALLNIQEDKVNEASAELDQLRALVAEGLVAKAELETSEQSLTALRAQVAATKKQLADSDRLLVEIQAEQALAKAQAAMPAKSPVKLVAKSYGTFASGPSVLRFSGAASWSIARLGEVKSYFASTFDQALPTSAVGQSATHNQLGWDHRNAVDVALHPDSAAGKSLINYLQSQGIPFLAFRAAIPGVATGPHIHIGNPSHRL